MEIPFSEAVSHNTQTLQLLQELVASEQSPKASNLIKNVRHIPEHFSLCSLICHWSKDPKPNFFKYHDSRIWRHTLVGGRQRVCCCRHKRHGGPFNWTGCGRFEIDMNQAIMILHFFRKLLTIHSINHNESINQSIQLTTICIWNYNWLEHSKKESSIDFTDAAHWPNQIQLPICLLIKCQLTL